MPFIAKSHKKPACYDRFIALADFIVNENNPPDVKPDLGKFYLHFLSIKELSRSN